MAKRVIKINRVGAPAGAPASGPTRPTTLAEEAANKASLSQTQPMKRIVVNAKSQERRSAMATRAAAPRTTGPNKQRTPQKKSGPPLWLIPVGVVGVVILVVIFSSSGRSQDPYFQSGAIVEQARPQRVLNQHTGPRPMKAYMEKHGPSDMAKARATRMKRKPAGSK